MPELLPGFKQRLYEKCMETIREKMERCEKELESLGEGLANDTKSTAGDKHETSRAMMHLEQEKLSASLNKLKLQWQQMQKINPEQTRDRVSTGSLFQSNQGYFFVSTALGKIEADGVAVFCLSADSPLIHALSGAGKDEVITFNNNSIRIISIV